MIYFSKHNRSTQEELMDDFSLQGEPLQEVLKDLDTVNRYLGGNQITIDGLEKMLLGCDKNRVVTIVDYGCGDGGSMALCAAYLEKHHWRYKLIGLDANAYIIEQAKTKAHSLKHSTFKVCNVFDKEKLPEADIALCTLFLHHFKEAQIIELLNAIATKTQVGIVINDLQRSRTAFRLFQLFSEVFMNSKIAKFDGLVSIARSFVKCDIKNISEKIIGTRVELKSKWAFRWRWLLYTGKV
ncbi:MAG: 2-polyprenyl-3-methyl-5-hydroxy-6-metoxy-1,4-benzoquinol methylase [Planctomycetota bacterium]|jgi:2-polyprenyl-3-methyl-5-hydroxy-6-metoxy-1,4-benzoquinol methylase|uniref:methyltransferase domain-containing protein n=1 Tax=Patiriisocius sp. Uisw_047 TaxID=3230969 RepID=UPI0039E9C3D1